MAGNEIVEREEWFKRDPVTGNFVHADPPKQFTPSDLTGMLERRAKDAAEIERLQAEVERLRPRTADDLICIIRDWLGSDDATHWGQFEQQLDAALTATDEKEG